MSPRDPFLAVACLGLIGVALASLYWASGFSTTVALSSLIGVVAVMPALLSWWRRRFDILEIIHPIMVSFVIYFGVRALYVVNFGVNVDNPFTPDFSDAIDAALTYTLIGMAGFLVGYYSRIADMWTVHIRPSVGDLPARRGVWAVMGLFILGLTCWSWVYAMGYSTRFLAGHRPTMPAYLMAVHYLAYVSYYALMLGVALACRPKVPRAFKAFLWLIVVPATFVMAAVGGAKADIVWLLIGIIMANHYLKRPVRLRTLFISGCVFFLMVFPLVNLYRNVSAMNLDLSPLQVVALAPDWGSYGAYFDESLLGAVLGEVMARSTGIDALALLIKTIPDYQPFQYGKTIAIAPLVAFIPTFLWSGKYEYIESVTGSGEFGEKIFGIPGNIRTGISITQLGELYLNFGWIGIPVGMCLIGVVCRLAYRLFIKYGPNPLTLMVYLFVYVHLIFIEGWFFSTYSNLLKSLVITGFIVLLLKAKTRSNYAVRSKQFGDMPKLA